MRLRDAGERRVVEEILRLLSPRWRCPSLGPGDDAACLGPGGIERLLLKIDGGAVESSWAPWMTGYELGWTWVAAAASDLAAKAARPLGFVLSIGLSPGEEESVLLDIVRGAADSAEAHGAWLLGGDTNSSPRGRGWVDVAAVGEALPAWGPLGRRPRRGDAVATTVGRYGLGWLARLLLEGRLRGERRREAAVEALRRGGYTKPLARLGFARAAAELPPGCLTGGIDVSDGLADSLRLLAEAAGAAVLLDRAPSLSPSAAAVLGEAGPEAALYGGQEYEVVFTARPDCLQEVLEALRREGVEAEPIGWVVEGPRGAVGLRGRGWLPVAGWDGFRGWEGL